MIEATGGIFTGLQTGADDLYIVWDVQPAGANVRARVTATGKTVELEPDLLHPLASGGDVDRYALLPLRSMLLFPYRRDPRGKMELMPWNAIEALPRTAAYLREHEPTLRSRERGKMDHDSWYAYTYPKSLGLHDSPKLGVAATVRRMEVAGDLDGGVYFHNVRVNGIRESEDGPSLPALLAVLNTKLLDYIFRLHSVPFANGHFAANKQFIASLPIKVPDNGADDLEDLGRSLHGAAAEIGAERRKFLDWLMDQIGADPRDLPGQRTFLAYDSASIGELLDRLRRLFDRVIKVDPTGRAFRDRFDQEHSASVERLQTLRRDLADFEAEADRLVYDLYGITEADRELVNAAYGA